MEPRGRAASAFGTSLLPPSKVALSSRRRSPIPSNREGIRSARPPRYAATDPPKSMAEMDFFPEQRNLEDLWLSAFPDGPEWENDYIEDFEWSFENLEETLEEGGELYGKTVYLFGSTEPQLLYVDGETKIVVIPVVVAAMKMAWVPYVPLEDRLSMTESLKTKIFTLGYPQQSSALEHLETGRFCMPYYMPLQHIEDEDHTHISFLYPLDPPILCHFDWESDDCDDYAYENKDVPEDEKERFKEFLKEKVREGKRELKQAKEARKKAIDDIDPKTKEAFENNKFYKFYPVKTPDTPDVTKVKSRYINKYYRNAHYLM